MEVVSYSQLNVVDDFLVRVISNCSVASLLIYPVIYVIVQWVANSDNDDDPEYEMYGRL